MRTIGTHLLTAVATLVVAWIGFAGWRRVEMQVVRPGAVAPPPATGVRPPAPAPRVAAPPAAAPPATAAPAVVLTPDESTNVRVYAAVNKSVVNITTSMEGLGFFGDEAESGSGSGFVIDNRGHILTNFHVIEGAETLQVTLHDGSTQPAEVIGLDPSNDVAVLKIAGPTPALAPLVLGDSSNLLVGQKVLAVGNPFGLERTLTTGIVSALDRSMRAKNGRQIKGIIQTDAAINPGNSGGPLLNARGEVVGMTTAIISQVGQSAGIGFAVPVNAIKRILGQLIEHGRVIRADLGVRRLLATEDGLLVVDLVDDGPAAQAGLREMQLRVERLGPYRIRRPDPRTADLIVRVDGQPVTSVDDLLTAVETHAPGETCVVTVLREGQPQDLTVTLGESP